MIIWTGWGFVSAILFFAGAGIGFNIFENNFGVVIGLIVASAVNFPIGRAINDPSKDRIVVDSATGERMQLKKRSTLFFIPMEWWSVIMLIVSIIGVVGMGLS